MPFRHDGRRTTVTGFYNANSEKRGQTVIRKQTKQLENRTKTADRGWVNPVRPDTSNSDKRDPGFSVPHPGNFVANKHQPKLHKLVHRNKKGLCRPQNEVIP